jgi:multiple sugar transport system substrate-binding protein
MCRKTGLGLLVLAALLSFGCAKKEAPAEANSLRGTSINVFLGTIAWTDFIKLHIPEFEQKTGITVNLETSPETQLRNKIVVELTARSRTIDVYSVTPPQEIPLFTKNGWVTALDDFIAKSPEYDIADYMPGAIAGSKADGKVYGIPLFTERPVLYYRTDIFESLGIEVPKTFDELLAVAKRLHDPANRMYGFAERGQAAGSITQFYAFIYGFGANPQSADFKTATANSPEMMAAYEFYGDILGNYGPPGVLNMNWGETMNLFAEGLVAMRVDCDSQYATAVDPTKSQVAANVGFAPFPAGPNGFCAWNVAPWGLCIPAFSEKKDAAWEFLRWATSKEMALAAMRDAGQFSPRQSPWNDPAVTDTLPESLVSAVKTTMVSPYAIERPVCIQVGKSRDIIGTVVQAAIQGTRGAELQRLADRANAEFQTLLNEDYN